MMLERSSLWMNYVLVIIVMMLWGMNVAALKILVEYMEPAGMQALRIFAAGVVLLLIIAYKGEWRTFSLHEWKHMSIASVLGIILHHFFLAAGLANTSAVNTSLIMALVPLTTAILAMLLLHDSVTKLKITGVIVALAGAVLISAAGSGPAVSRLSIGDVFVFIAMFSQAASFVYIRKATHTLGSRELTGFMFLIGSAGLFAVSVAMEDEGITSAFSAPLWVWAVFTGSAVLATALGHQIFNRSIQRIGAGETAVFNNFVPFFGMISSAWFLNEAIYPGQLGGFFFIVVGVLLGTGYVEQKWLQHKKRHLFKND
ncbi:DMT family transporter [Salibacterium sp. K-3]